MKEVVWKDEYNLDVKKIDLQHQKLFEYLNEIRHSVVEKKRKEAISKTLKDLINYGIEHFSDEEDMLKKNNYPFIDEHQKMHDSFNGKLLRLDKKIVNGDDIMATELIIFIKKWLIEHILIQDKKYADYFSEKNIKL